MEYSAFGLIDEKELLDFSQNFNVTRNYVGSRLFPDRKTQYLQSEYYRYIRNGNLPQIAEVHAFDTEAKIGNRVSFEHVEIEKLLIKEKINQTEALRELTRGMRMDNIRQYIFDDVAREAEKVVTRVEKAKIDAITLGKYVIEENNLKTEIDYQIPAENKVKTWWDENADILGDIIKWVDQAEEGGPTPTQAITTRKVFRKIANNKFIQRHIFSAIGEGQIPTLTQVNGLLQEQIGVTILIDEDKYGTLDDKGAMKSNRFFPEDTFVLYAPGNDGSLGIGLWGVTPEESIGGEAFTAMQERQFVTVTQWMTQDPTAVWTKASGLFVPVLPNVYSHIIANVADVSSKPQDTLPSSVSLPLSVENGGTGASTADAARTNLEAMKDETVPLTKGGTGATSAANARTALDVYSKSEVDAKTVG